jgi:hypothetical protein
MMRRFSSSALGFGSALLFVIASSWPQAAVAAPPQDDLVRRGLVLRRAHQDAAALELFQKAFASSPSTMIGAQIALAKQALGRWIEAERDLQAALAAPDPWVDAHRRVLLQSLGVIQSHLGWLEVTSSLESTEVWLDDERLVTLADSVHSEVRRVTAGRHELSLSAPDGRRIEQTFELEPGARYVYHAEWPSVAAKAAAEPALAAPPGAPARVEVTAASRAPAEHRSVAESPLRPLTHEASKPSATRTLAYASAAVAIVALSEAVAASLVRLDYVHRYNGPSCYPQRSVQCAPYRDVANTLGTAAVVGYVIGAAAGLGSIALFTWPGADSLGRSAQLTFSGRF